MDPTGKTQDFRLPPEEEKKTRSGARTLLHRGAPLVIAGVIGAGVAVGVGVAVGPNGSTTAATTIVQQVAAESSAQQPAAFAPSDQNLSIEQIYQRSAPGVVRITATSTVQGQDPFGFNGGPQQQQALGSGFVIDKAGHIVTNYHVVQGAQELRVSFSGKEPIPAKLVGVDPSTDLAVIKVDVPAEALTPLPLGNSDAVKVGDSVVAIGNPFGLDRTITAGIISALQRGITAPNGYPIDHVLQTDAAINHGNSGGPLLDSRGEVIGVNAQIQAGTVDGNVGIGFAIPVNTVKAVASQLIQTGKVEHPFLGVELQPVTSDLVKNYHLPVDHGVMIASVRPGTPAEKAGLKGGNTKVTVNGQDYVLGGDIITKIDGQDATSINQVRDVILAKKPGDKITLEINRNGQTLNVSVELGRQPTTPTG